MLSTVDSNIGWNSIYCELYSCVQCFPLLFSSKIVLHKRFHCQEKQRKSIMFFSHNTDSITSREFETESPCQPGNSYNASVYSWKIFFQSMFSHVYKLWHKTSHKWGLKLMIKLLYNHVAAYLIKFMFTILISALQNNEYLCTALNPHDDAWFKQNNPKYLLKYPHNGTIS